MGAWIETEESIALVGLHMSHPTWVRGLKLLGSHAVSAGLIVAPYMGAWIETSYLPYFAKNYQVAPYMGAWIETIIYSDILLVL